MRLVSVNVGSPHNIGEIQGTAVTSGIIKSQVDGPVVVKRLNLEGDRQADLEVHGGEDKAVYAYPSEHYRFWKDRFPEMDMPWGTFGENLTTEGLLEGAVHIGDIFAIGSAVLQVTQPRFPCYKLGLRFGTQTMVKLFLESERTGFYLKVMKEGQVKAGDELKPIERAWAAETVTDIVREVKRSE
ncbi:MAG: MOSC domain-containing protein [Thaumarchaeota archaeon]|nr:MOSC domain-containing protein [Nitrososphaerota archaeon]